ncbi:MAG: hypothetical protein LUF04_06935 [Bacteroides sp.]|nr:hypothetical protein [Bacteroides sp.]
MKKICFSLLFLILSLPGFSQNETQYDEYTTEALALFEEEKYLQAARLYSKAFSLPEVPVADTDRYNAAACWSMAGQVDSAFVQLYKIAGNGDYEMLEYINGDTDLDNLRSDYRWEEVMSLLRTNKLRADIRLNRPLMAKLEKIYDDVLLYRNQYQEIRQQYGPQSELLVAQLDLIREQDSIQLAEITQILDKRGWLGKEIVGRKGNRAFFMVLQYADPEVQEKYLPMMREAVKAGEAYPADLAQLEDQLAIEKHGKQLYGTQIGYDAESGKYYIYPVEDPYRLNERRSAVGLNPMQDYLNLFGLVWNPQLYGPASEEE